MRTTDWSALDSAEKVSAVRDAWRALTQAGQIASASRIAAKIGGITRNALIGVYHRNKAALLDFPLEGVSLGGRGGRPKKEPTSGIFASRKPKTPNLPKPPEPKVAIAPVFECVGPGAYDATCHRVPLDQLASTDCHFPLGDPLEDADFGYCGHGAIEGKSYCAHHYARVYQVRERPVRRRQAVAA